MRCIFLKLTLFLVGPITMAAAQTAFLQTEVGVSEFKTLPAGVLLKAQGEGSYFDGSDRLFRSLFNYISSHDIAMTTPVEAQIDRAAMYFWVAQSERSKIVGSTGEVEVVEVPERRVASRGARGSYSQQNVEATRDTLLAWLSTQGDVERAGQPYAVFWNGPFTPGSFFAFSDRAWNDADGVSH